ncbi:hypothetical protein [Flindersiella endophytica]
MAVHRRVPDARGLRDQVQGRVGTPFVEDLPGGRQQAVVVALRVGPAGSHAF